MPLKSPSTQFWLFTEHRNATFIINFLLPLQTASTPSAVEFESWSSEDVEKFGIDEITRILRVKANGTHPKAAIFSRFVRPLGLALIALCKSLGILTIFHLDDLLQKLPEDIGQKYAAIYSDAYIAELDQCLCAADGVIASTPILAAQIKKRHPQLSIQTILGTCYVPVPGWRARGMRARLARFKRKLTTAGIQTIGYMGSSSHTRDLATITPQIAELMRLRPNLQFESLGLPAPTELKVEFGNRVRQYGFTSTYSEFLITLYELRWDLGLAPLVRDEFNQAKTATKFIEYTACDIPTLAENFEPYSKIGHDFNAVALATNGAWIQAAVDLLSDPTVRHDQLRRALEICQTRFTGTIAVEQLLTAVDQLAKQRKLAGETYGLN